MQEVVNPRTLYLGKEFIQRFSLRSIMEVANKQRCEQRIREEFSKAGKRFAIISASPLVL